jgi:hypothetical protein
MGKLSVKDPSQAAVGRKVAPQEKAPLLRTVQPVENSFDLGPGSDWTPHCGETTYDRIYGGVWAKTGLSYK